MNILSDAQEYPSRISASGLSIYDPVEIGSDLWIPSDHLEVLLQTVLAGVSLGSLPIRTRSKVMKSLICQALGYPVPSSFTKTRPRFPGQNFDTSVQKANNFQPWNEAISPTRRYVLIRPDSEGVIRRVKVLGGSDLAPLDRTGTLTRKFQARVLEPTTVRLVGGDSANLSDVLEEEVTVSVAGCSPVDFPATGELLPIKKVFELLSPLVGVEFVDPGVIQERNRGGELHRLVSDRLGYSTHADNGKFPDVRHQLLEVKLQTSPTIDLGAFSPDSGELLDCPALGDVHVRHQDVRYAVFYGRTDGMKVTITGLTVVAGVSFFDVFEKCGCLGRNEKLQMHLPRNFFDANTEGLFD